MLHYEYESRLNMNNTAGDSSLRRVHNNRKQKSVEHWVEGWCSRKRQEAKYEFPYADHIF